MYSVYYIKVNNIVRYIGRTNNLHRRQLEHNRSLRNGKGKDIHNFILSNNIQSIELVLIKEFKTKTESKRYEMYLILQDHFNKKNLIQKVPNISDR